MGLSSNQARFLSLTARQVDMEQRIQQICQRRLRLSSELENVATAYNNKISNRKMFTANQTNQGINTLSLANLKKLGYSVIDADSKKMVDNVGLMNKPGAANPAANVIGSEQDFLNLLSVINAGGANATLALGQNYVLNCDIDLSDNPDFNKNVIAGTFTGTFDGQGHTISGATINASGTDTSLGFFSINTGTIKNLELKDISLNVPNFTGATQPCNMGILAAVNNGTVTNVAAVDSEINAGNNQHGIGGLLGQQGTGTLTYSYANTTINAGTDANYVGGLVGDVNSGSTIQQCYYSGDITVGANSKWVGGLAAGLDSADPSLIENCYSTGNITAAAGSGVIGGLVDGSWWAGSTIKSSYSTMNSTYGGNIAAGFTGYYSAGTVGADNFYKSISPSDQVAAVVNENTSTARPQNNWSTTYWDLSGDMPTLKGTNDGSEDLETGLRNGRYSLAKEADEFTQDPLSLNGGEYEEVDWRSTPELYDELYRGDDVDAENKYDKIVSEINAQDKKLQLEQTSIEVEYKAVTSERESVKKILDTNAQSSFKYFS